ncbi:NAD(P)/FAD-dependent oxidoreductase [Luteimonas salinilitoris]|uniref:NAD(P)/FAD-dependent oxidoreductase n=1 Tax=Luteimonas salinilitoris TaxID=3237697 RepID=A0ABV4HVA7_9GAMM
MREFDLIVVGAGIIGASCAERAVAGGRRVAIVEADVAGGGVTAASMGHLVAMDGDPAELALARYSLGLWAGFEGLAAADFSRCGTLWVAANETEMAAVPGKIARLGKAGIHAERIDAGRLRELEPHLAPDLAGGLLVPGEGTVYPPRAVAWLIGRCIDAGAILVRGRHVLRVLRDGVALDDGAVLRGPVLVAAGAASNALLPELPMHVRRGHLVITDRHPGLLRHQVLELGYADSAHGDAEVSVAFNVQPRPTGQLLIGSSRERREAGPEVHPSVLRRMLERAFRYLPVLRGLQAIRAWTGLRPCTADGRPYIGAVPGRADCWVATGHEGLGVTAAPGTARLLLDLIDGRHPAIDPAPYDPARVAA